MSKVLVIGATGTVGSHLVSLLEKQGETAIKASSRAPTEKNQVVLNVLTKEGIHNVKNVDKLFLLSPPGHTNQDELLIPLIEQAQKANLSKVVLMTAMGVDANDQAPLRKVELLLEKSGLAFNIIRPNWFMQNFNSFWIHGINHHNKILLPVEKAAGSFIDARDIAAVAAKLLTTDQLTNQAFNLTGAEALNHDEVAALLSKVTKRSITYESITPSAMKDILLSAGLPNPYAEFLLVILDLFRQGYAAGITDSVQKITGQSPIRFTEYAETYKASWAK